MCWEHSERKHHTHKHHRPQQIDERRPGRVEGSHPIQSEPRPMHVYRPDLLVAGGKCVPPSSQTESSERLETVTDRGHCSKWTTLHVYIPIPLPHPTQAALACQYKKCCCCYMQVSWWRCHRIRSAMHCMRCAVVQHGCVTHACVCVGGGDEGGHPLPGLRGESQEAHLQDGRYVRTCIAVYILVYVY